MDRLDLACDSYSGRGAYNGESTMAMPLRVTEQCSSAAIVSVEPAIIALNRRSFLKAGFVLGAGISTGLSLTGCSSPPGTMPDGIQFISTKHLPMFDKLIAVLLPVEGSILTPPNTVPVIANIDAMLGVMNASTREDVLVLFDLFEYSSFFSTKLSRFSQLDDDDARSHIEECQSSSVFIQRAVVTAMKKFIYISYWRDEKTWSPIEFDGPVSKQWNLPSLGNAPLPAV